MLVDSTPVECARSRDTVKRAGASSFAGGAIADAADYGCCASHSRYFWGLRLHTLMASDGTPRAIALGVPKASEREICLELLARVNRHGPLTVIGDWAHAGFDGDLDARIVSGGSRGHSDAQTEEVSGRVGGAGIRLALESERPIVHRG